LGGWTGGKIWRITRYRVFPYRKGSNMKKIMPQPKVINTTRKKTKTFRLLDFENKNLKLDDWRIIVENKMWNVHGLSITAGAQERTDGYMVAIYGSAEVPPGADDRLFRLQGYTLRVEEKTCELFCFSREGLVYALATIKQMLEGSQEGFYMEQCSVSDWPAVEMRAVSNTFAWYAGYGRMGFDMQLWGFEEWKEYLDICSDFKINHFNMCMYGYWPFAFPEYPETQLKDMPMKIWNKESRNWVAVNYTHQNLADPFLERLIDYGHSLGIRFFAYVGLNSYSGGYASEHKEKRMKLPAGSPYVNDFDRLCLSDAENITYMKAAMQRIIRLGFDGIDFEESEEAFWYCDCEDCRKNFLQGHTPEEASHIANNALLKELYAVIRQENPNCEVGIRAWRQPPLEKSGALLREMTKSVPADVGLFWAPGQYVPEGEFKKWADAFGRERIWGRDTESNAVAACFGRLIRIFRENGLRCEEETNDQFLEEDIRQHQGSAALGVRGVNGYMFEWYGFFMHLFAHAFYGWGSQMEKEAFYSYALESIFGPKLAGDVLYILKNLFTIHESQMKIFPTEFPFARNKVEERDISRIRTAIDGWPDLMARIGRVQAAVAADAKLCVYEPHFEKLRVSCERSRVLYDLALASIAYDGARTEEEKRRWLLEMFMLNEKDFDIVKNNYLDVNPVDLTGTRSCMIPCHELRRVILNELCPKERDDVPIYLGVEALGWLWL